MKKLVKNLGILGVGFVLTAYLWISTGGIIMSRSFPNARGFYIYAENVSDPIMAAILPYLSTAWLMIIWFIAFSLSAIFMAGICNNLNAAVRRRKNKANISKQKKLSNNVIDITGIIREKNEIIVRQRERRQRDAIPENRRKIVDYIS